jgi:hypothetical protein
MQYDPPKRRALFALRQSVTSQKNVILATVVQVLFFSKIYQAQILHTLKLIDTTSELCTVTLCVTVKYLFHLLFANARDSAL